MLHSVGPDDDQAHSAWLHLSHHAPLRKTRPVRQIMSICSAAEALSRSRQFLPSFTLTAKTWLGTPVAEWVIYTRGTHHETDADQRDAG